MKKRKLLVQILAGIMAFVMILGLVLSILPSRASAAMNPSAGSSEVSCSAPSAL